MFNFRHLPLQQAKKFPIVFYKHAYGKVTNGGKIILSDNVIRQKRKFLLDFHLKILNISVRKQFLILNMVPCILTVGFAHVEVQ